MNAEDRSTLDRMFFPRGIALFGGISRPGSFGQLILHSQVRYGYRGRVYPISRKGGEIAGIPILGSLAEADGPVDLASVSVPAEAVPAVLDQCLAHRVGGAQIHSSGFAETGKPEGIALEARLADFIARGLRIVGPNCFGIHCPLGGITLLPGFDFSARPGPVAFVSQSGGVATDFGYEAECAGLGLSKIISFGNGCDLDAAALFDYLADDPETGYVAAYLEGVRDGRTFFDALRRTASKKPVVIWKAGLTPLGSRAACSHTGSMAGGAEAWEGVLRQTGAAPVQGLDDMMDALVALRYLENPVRRIALMGGGGAIGVFGSDLAHRWGMEIPTFSSETRKRLRRHFPTPGNSMKNPLDTGTPVLPLETVRSLAREVLTREPVDALILILLMRPLEVELPNFLRMSGMDPPPGGSYLKGLVEDLSTLKRETGKEVIMVLENRARKVEEVTVEEIYRQSRRLFQEQGIPVFPRVQRALRGLHHAAAGAARLRTARGC